MILSLISCYVNKAPEPASAPSPEPDLDELIAACAPSPVRVARL